MNLSSQAQNTGIWVADPSSGSEIVITIAAESQLAVDQWRQKRVETGGQVVTEPPEIPEGNNVVFADLDGYYWNGFFHRCF